MPVSEEDERELKVAVMEADLTLKRKQAFWETPRNIALLVGAAAGISGVLGFKLGQKDPPPAPPPTQIIFQPGAIQVAPSPAPVPAGK